MKAILTVLLFCTSALFAADLPPLAAPDLKSPLPSEWSVRHGKWEPKDGVLTVAELPENKHAAVLWHTVELQAGAVECAFQFNGAKSLLLGCDGDKHIGRIIITPKLLRLMDDSSEVKGKTPSTELSSSAVDLKPGEWYSLRYEWDGEKMSATLAGARVEASHPNLGKKKARWWFAVSGDSLNLRDIKVFGKLH